MSRLWMPLVLLTLAMSGLVRAEHDEAIDIVEQMERLELAERTVDVSLRERMADLEIEEKQVEIEHARRALEHRPHDGRPLRAIVLLAMIVIRILLGIWVYQDGNSRDARVGLWLVLVVIGGLLAALVYSIVRLGDVKANGNGRKKS